MYFRLDFAGETSVSVLAEALGPGCLRHSTTDVSSNNYPKPRLLASQWQTDTAPMFGAIFGSISGSAETISRLPAGMTDEFRGQSVRVGLRLVAGCVRSLWRTGLGLLTPKYREFTGKFYKKAFEDFNRSSIFQIIFKRFY